MDQPIFGIGQWWALVHARQSWGAAHGANKAWRCRWFTKPPLQALLRRKDSGRASVSEGVEVWRGSVPTWECDSNLHMNIRFYVAKSSIALVGLADELGLHGAFNAGAATTLVVREQHSRLIREGRLGNTLWIIGGVLEMGESDARFSFIMRHLDGRLAASFQSVVDHVTSADGTPVPWPATVREKAKDLQVDVPADAAPRSLTVEPVTSRASVARAREIGMLRAGMGAITPPDCDVFGRMRPEMLLGHISDGNPNVLSDGPPLDGGNIGGAALEFRTLHLKAPRAGDRFELVAGGAWADHKVRSQIHWMLDPVSGEAWGAAECISVSVDMALRKIIVLDDEALAAARAECLPGISL